MIENNYFTDNPDLLEHMESFIDWSRIVNEYENGFGDAALYQNGGDERYATAPSSLDEALELYQTILAGVGELAGKEVAPQAAAMSREGVKYEAGRVTFPEAFKSAFYSFKSAGLIPYAIHREYGGLGVPVTVQALILELLGRADVAFTLTVGCVNICEVLQGYASREMQEEWLPRFSAVEYIGAMALTEPDYGSDLANLQLRAEQDNHGVWRLNGTKRFITLACGMEELPGIVFTLARTGTPKSGARGLSFFMVKSEDVEIAGIEKKLGLSCSPTCEVIYEDVPGILIGGEGEGLIKGAMAMMNTSRLSIAAQSLGVAVAACEEAKKYASERRQFGRLLNEIPAVAEILSRMEREIFGLRALLTESSAAVDHYVHRRNSLLAQGLSDRELRRDGELRRADRLASMMTPLSKFYIGEQCNVIAYDALQVLGGSGYIEDYDLARIYRDARISTIYEGTSQLQVVAAIGGVVAGMADGGFLREYIDEELKKIDPTSELLELKELFEQSVAAFQKLPDNESRESLAVILVESTARYLSSILLERMSGAANPERKELRQKQSAAHRLDSLGIVTGNLLKLQRPASKKRESG